MGVVPGFVWTKPGWKIPIFCEKSRKITKKYENPGFVEPGSRFYVRETGMWARFLWNKKKTLLAERRGARGGAPADKGRHGTVAGSH